MWQGALIFAVTWVAAPGDVGLVGQPSVPPTAAAPAAAPTAVEVELVEVLAALASLDPAEVTRAFEGVARSRHVIFDGPLRRIARVHSESSARVAAALLLGELDWPLAAEDLETRLATLGELGIEFGQGWLFGKPTPLRARES